MEIERQSFDSSCSSSRMIVGCFALLTTVVSASSSSRFDWSTLQHLRQPPPPKGAPQDPTEPSSYSSQPQDVWRTGTTRSQQQRTWLISQAFQSAAFGSDTTTTKLKTSGYGASVKISSEGTVLAVGSPLEDTAYVYRSQEDDRNTWFVQPLNGGQTIGQHFGQQVAVSASGNTVAVGSYLRSNGYNNATTALASAGGVSLYRWNEQDSGFQSYNQDIHGSLTNERMGWSVAVSEGIQTGIRVATGNLAGAPREIDPATGLPRTVPGQVKMFRVAATNASTTRTPAGYAMAAELEEVLQEEDAGELFGFSIATSDDGSILAVGASRFQDGLGRIAGRVQVYRQQDEDGAVEKLGGSLLGMGEEHLGTQVAVSSSGKTIAVCGWLDDENLAATSETTETGEESTSSLVLARVYDFFEGTWNQRGSEIQIPYAQVDSYGGGIALALSGDGKTLALRAAQHGQGGMIALYQWQQASSWVLQQEISQQVLIESGIVSSEIHFGWSIDLNHDGSSLAVGSIALYEDEPGYAFMFEQAESEEVDYFEGVRQEQEERELQDQTEPPSDQPSSVPISDVGGEPSAVPTVITDKPSPAPTGPPSTGSVTSTPTSEPTRTCAPPLSFCFVDANCCVDGSTCLIAEGQTIGLCISPATIAPTGVPTEECVHPLAPCQEDLDCCVDGSTCFKNLPTDAQGLCLSPATFSPTAGPTPTCAQPGGFCAVDGNCCVAGSTCLIAQGQVFGACVSPATAIPTAGPTNTCATPGGFCAVDLNCCVPGSTCVFQPGAQFGNCQSPPTSNPTSSPSDPCVQPGGSCGIDSACCVPGSTCLGAVLGIQLGVCESPASLPPTSNPTVTCSQPGGICAVDENCCLAGSTCPVTPPATTGFCTPGPAPVTLPPTPRLGTLPPSLSPPTAPAPNPTSFPTPAPSTARPTFLTVSPTSARPTNSNCDFLGVSCSMDGNCCSDYCAGLMGMNKVCKRCGLRNDNCASTTQCCASGDPDNNIAAGTFACIEVNGEGLCKACLTETTTCAMNSDCCSGLSCSMGSGPMTCYVVPTAAPSLPPTTAKPTLSPKPTIQPTTRPTFVPTTAEPTRSNCRMLDADCTMSMECCTGNCAGMMGMNLMCVRCGTNTFNCNSNSDCCQPAFGSGLSPRVCKLDSNSGDSFCEDCITQGTTGCSADTECCPGNRCNNMNKCVSSTSSPSLPPGKCIGAGDTCNDDNPCCTSGGASVCTGAMNGMRTCQACAGSREICSSASDCCGKQNRCSMNMCCMNMGTCSMNNECCTGFCNMSNNPMCAMRRRNRPMRNDMM